MRKKKTSLASNATTIEVSKKMAKKILGRKQCIAQLLSPEIQKEIKYLSQEMWLNDKDLIEYLVHERYEDVVRQNEEIEDTKRQIYEEESCRKKQPKNRKSKKNKKRKVKVTKKCRTK
jgi:hypothetical protein